MFGQYRLPFVESRYLVSASQFDLFQLPYDEGSSPPYSMSNGQLAYASSFQAAVRGVFVGPPRVAPTASQAAQGSAVFSSACFKHCTSNAAAFWDVKVAGVSLKDFLASWLEGEAPTTWVENCSGTVD